MMQKVRGIWEMASLAFSLSPPDMMSHRRIKSEVSNSIPLDIRNDITKYRKLTKFLVNRLGDLALNFHIVVIPGEESKHQIKRLSIEL
jgi:hypothetical protein